MFRKILIAACVLVPTAAQAEWKEASSEHFQVYSNGSRQTLQNFTEKLEKFDFLLRTVSGSKQPASPTKLKVYLMEDYGEVQKTLGPAGSRGIAGYYTARPRGAIAVGVSNATLGRDNMSAESTLLHEYTHHFMHHYFPASYPSWYSEGFAEYYGQIKIGDNDVIEVGHPADTRYYSFSGNDWMPVGQMLAARSYADVGPKLHLLYAEGWLLTHYVAQNPARKAQLDKYLNLINAGKSYEDATNEAFGAGAKQLDSELRKYAAKTRHEVTVLPFKKIPIKPITIRQVSPAEDALMGQEIALGRGVYRLEAADFGKNARAIARRFPDDAYALGVLIEAERAAGDNAAALQAVDRLLALKPKDPRGLMHQGELQIAALKAAKSTDKAAWAAARELIITAHKARPNDAMMLAAYYDSYAAEGVMPPAGAQNALYRAHELTPRDGNLRYQVALDFEQRGMLEEALAVIKPSAFELHSDEADPKKKKKQEEQEEKYREVGQSKRETAREMFLRLEQKLVDAGKTQTAAVSAD